METLFFLKFFDSILKNSPKILNKIKTLFINHKKSVNFFGEFLYLIFKVLN